MGVRPRRPRLSDRRYHAGTTGSPRSLRPPDLDMRLYPRTFLLPGGDVLRVGPDEMTSRLEHDVVDLVERRFDGPRPAHREAAVLLPAWIASSRWKLAPTARRRPTRRRSSSSIRARPACGVDRADAPRAPVHERRPPARWRRPRRRRRTGRPGEGPARTAELFDTQTETWRRMAPQAGSRMYHSTALLLPDGRVLSAGQNEGDLQRTAEILTAYLFRAPRPGSRSRRGSRSTGVPSQSERPTAHRSRGWRSSARDRSPTA